MKMTYRIILATALGCACIHATRTMGAVVGLPPPLHEYTHISDLIAEVQILTSSNVVSSADAAVTQMLDDLVFSSTGREVREGRRTAPYNGFWQTTMAEVITPLKGCRAGEIIHLDFNDADKAAVLFDRSERCLVFLRRFDNGHYAVIDRNQGRHTVLNELVLNWHEQPVKDQRFRWNIGGHSTPLTNVVEWIRAAVAANARDAQLDITLAGRVSGAATSFSLSVTNRGPASVDIFGPMTRPPSVVVFRPDGTQSVFGKWGAFGPEEMIPLYPNTVLERDLDLKRILDSLRPGQHTICVQINTRYSNRVVVDISATGVQNKASVAIGTDTPRQQR